MNLKINFYSFKQNQQGEFKSGKFSNVGVFTRNDQMKFEGEFRDGSISGRGLVTFADGSHGIPRNEGVFDKHRLIRPEKCAEIVYKANAAAEGAKRLCNAKLG